MILCGIDPTSANIMQIWATNPWVTARYEQNKIWRFGAVVLYPSEHRPVVAAD
jgi:hypothetical protein